MQKIRTHTAAVLLVAATVASLAACGDMKSVSPTDPPSLPAPLSPAATDSGAQVRQDEPVSSGSAQPDRSADKAARPGEPAPPKPETNPANPTGDNGKTDQPNAKQVVAKPDDIAVLVNKTYALPENFKPKDLVEPNVPFIFKEKSEKRLMRKEAAEALEKLFAGAKKDGVYLAGVSGYRSRSTQKALFNRYVQKDGEEAARRYSAEPGHSEHETGLAMDVSGSDGKCAAEDCFAGTKEAKWLAEHAHEYGFIIRYPQGKESVTGYQYEPWHLRYVGNDIAKEIAEKGITLEEYYRSVPASK
jgi:D-alanyl-D-alanine carboxypeptidase